MTLKMALRRNVSTVIGIAIAVVSVLAVARGVSVKLADGPTTTKCYFYNSGSDCEVNKSCKNQTEECGNAQSNEMTACFAVWKNTSDNGFVMQNQGCWDNGNDCLDRTQCISDNTVTDNTFFCCCIGDLCNGEVSFHPAVTDSPQSTKGSGSNPTPVLTGDPLICTIIYSLVPISIFTIVTIVIYWMCRRYHYTSLVSIQTSEPSPLTTPLTPTATDFQPLQLIEVKARGRFGAVWKAQMNSRYVAVKVFPLQDRQSWISEQEIYSLPNMQHENILQFLGTEKRGEGLDTAFWLITEYHQRGSLYDYLKANLVSWNNLCHIAESMARGLAFLHEPCGAKPPIAHRDFKSKNVLLMSNTTACIADFGLAVKFDPGKKLCENHGQVGTRRYMAPEVLEGAIQFNQDAFMRLDMYACGLVIWELVSRCSAQDGPVDEYMLPFEEEVGQAPSLEEMIEAVVSHRKRPAFRDTWMKHSGLASLCETIEECWDHEAEARLTAGCVEARLSQLLRNSNQVITTTDLNHTNSSTTPLITDLSNGSTVKESSL